MEALFLLIALEAAYQGDLYAAGEVETAEDRANWLEAPMCGQAVIKNVEAGEHPNSVFGITN